MKLNKLSDSQEITCLKTVLLLPNLYQVTNLQWYKCISCFPEFKKKSGLKRVFHRLAVWAKNQLTKERKEKRNKIVCEMKKKERINCF